jgi:hypothetical protein
MSETELRIRTVVVPENEVQFTEEQRIPLSDADRDFLLSLLAVPPHPTSALRTAVRNRRRRDG